MLDLSGKIFQIAIDGPGGAGKSTIAKMIANSLNIEYIDTGAMYRAVAYKGKINDIDFNDSKAISSIIKDTKIDFKDGKIYLDERDVSEQIREKDISKLAAIVSREPSVRSKLVALQRQLGEEKSIVMDGRDIGSNVLKDAKFKIYMTASSEKRAERRFEELLSRGQKATFEEVLKDIEDRDFQDMNRKLNPLVKAEDAIEIDTTDMSIKQVVDKILKEVENGYS